MIYVSCPLIWRPASCNMYHLFAWQHFWNPSQSGLSADQLLLPRMVSCHFLLLLLIILSLSCDVTLHLDITVGSNHTTQQISRSLLPFFCTVRSLLLKVSLQGWNWEPGMYGLYCWKYHYRDGTESPACMVVLLYVSGNHTSARWCPPPEFHNPEQCCFGEGGEGAASATPKGYSCAFPLVPRAVQLQTPEDRNCRRACRFGGCPAQLGVGSRPGSWDPHARTRLPSRFIGRGGPAVGARASCAVVNHHDWDARRQKWVDDGVQLLGVL